MTAQPLARPRTQAQTHPVLVLGLGNILLGDEGVGVRVVEAMQGIDLPGDVELFDGGTLGLDLLDVLADRRKVIVLDAVDCDDEPGTIRRFSLDELALSSKPAASLHEVGLLETLTVAKRLGIAPQEVVVLGIVPKTVEYALTLSAELARLVPDVIDRVLAELDRESSRRDG